MTVEIERKFLVPRLPDDLDLRDEVELRQGYLAEEDETSVRLRIEPSGATLTVKAGRGRRRTEVEVALSPSEAEALWPHTAGRRVAKRRTRIPIVTDDGVGHVVDLDRYDGALDGLVTAEVEFADEAAAAHFVAPAWFGRDVTDEPGWTNAELARHGLPKA